ncbi:MAG: amidohydrolase family protein [Lapillicoccus sp.]
MSRRTLYRGGVVRVEHPQDPPATAFLVDRGRVVWVGRDADAPAADGAAETVDLAGALVTPAFVDAHAHLSPTGAALRGVDLSGARSLNEAVSRIETGVRRTGGRPVMAFGWDESAWPERRPFTARELDRAAYGGVVFASRVDGHSAVVSSALAVAARLAPADHDSGLVRADAHRRARAAYAATVTPDQNRADVEAALRLAAAQGIAEVHENAGPVISAAEDLADVQAVAGRLGLPRVVSYWAELVDSPGQARRLVEQHGAHGLAGDLNVDGSIGSRTASLRLDYLDAPGDRGQAFLTIAQVRDHVAACTRAGVQAGFHVIGDAGVDSVLAGFEAAAELVGADAVPDAHHRLEHVETIGPQDVARLARLGVVASMQPAFDAAWGGPRGMYAERLGVERAAGMNPLRSMVDAGVVLALGSDSPVTPLAPWETLRAAAHHHDPAQRLTPDEAFHAHTVGGHRAAGEGGGRLRVGEVASFAVWDAWSAWADTRGRLAVPTEGAPVPTARLVVRAGEVIHDWGERRA